MKKGKRYLVSSRRNRRACAACVTAPAVARATGPSRPPGPRRARYPPEEGQGSGLRPQRRTRLRVGYLSYSARPLSSSARIRDGAGLYFHYMTPHVIVGTQPQTPSDVSRLAQEESITAILNVRPLEFASLALFFSSHPLCPKPIPLLPRPPRSCKRTGTCGTGASTWR